MLPVKQDLTVYNFFTNYISDPLSSKLCQQHKIIALAASIILAPLTLGILHHITTIWRHKRIEAYRQKDIYSQGKLASLIQRVATSPAVMTLSPATRAGWLLSRDNLGSQVQSELVAPCYAKPLPPSGSVTVPVETDLPGGEKKVEWKLWKNLSAAEKLRVHNTETLPHNQLTGPFARYLVDFTFSPPFSNSNVPGDPRNIHGIDHAVRASLFSAVFAFLYQKYHPDYQVTEKDLLLAQFTAAGHDCGRQTEGPDVYDQKSAETTKKALERLGVGDQKDLEACYLAIAKKDDLDLQRKSLIAKCVQNADSMDFTRIQLQDTVQDPAEFEKSRCFLDIYKEFKDFQGKGRKLKDGCSFEEFQTELDALRIEMNGLVALTSRQKFRRKASDSGNYYEYVLRRITSSSFPLIHAVLQKTAVLPPEQKESIKPDVIAEAEAWADYGIQKASSNFLQGLLHKIQSVGSGAEIDRLIEIKATIENELQLRQKALEDYAKAKEQKSDKARVIEAYAKLPFVLQDDIQFLGHLKVSSFEALEQEIRGLTPSSSLALRFVEIKKQILRFNQLVKNHPEDPAALFEMAQQSSDLYAKFPEEYRDPRWQTTVAVALQKAAHIYSTQKNFVKFEEVVRFAEERLIPDSRLEASLKCLSPRTRMLEIGTDGVRKQRMRVEQKKIGGEDVVEISFELTSASRNNLLVQSSSPLYRVTHVTSHFERGTGAHTFSSEGADLPLFCQDLCIMPADSDSVRLYVGDSSIFRNQHHLMRLRFSPSTSIKEVQKLLCRIGFMTAFMPPRQEDVRQCSLARVLAMRHPKIVYSTVPKKDPQYIYDFLLSQEQRRQIDEDMRCLRRGFTGDAIEVVHPQFVQEIHTRGGRVLALGMDSGPMRATAKVLSNIFRCGFLSSQERAQRGILIKGFIPYLNNWARSANQVFTRILTHNVFQDSSGLNKFYLAGKIFVLVDIKACERLPYANYEDLCGVRNERMLLPAWPAPANEDLQVPFHGRTIMQRREGLSDFVGLLNQKFHFNNECMFDRSIGTQYIRKILVQSEKDRDILLDTLYRNNIRFDHGRRVEEMVVVADRLTPSLEEALGEQPKDEQLYDSLSGLS
jgi:hypothetical protein